MLRKHIYIIRIFSDKENISLCFIFTVRNSSCGKVMFLHLSVILFTGGSVWSDTPRARHPPGRHPLGRYPPWADPPRQTHPPPWQTHPLGSHTPARWKRPLQRTVRILLECILVCCKIIVLLVHLWDGFPFQKNVPFIF